MDHITHETDAGRRLQGRVPTRAEGDARRQFINTARLAIEAAEAYDFARARRLMAEAVGKLDGFEREVDEATAALVAVESDNADLEATILATRRAIVQARKDGNTLREMTLRRSLRDLRERAAAGAAIVRFGRWVHSYDDTPDAG